MALPNNRYQLDLQYHFFSLCSGEGAINVAGGPNRGQEVRVNGPIGAPGQMRMDVGFPGQPGPGIYWTHK